MTFKNLAGLLILVTSLTGCSQSVRGIDFNFEYPYDVKINTGLTELCRVEASILKDDTFQIGQYIFTYIPEENKVTQIEMPKVTSNTKENYRDNFIDEQNLNLWMSREDIRYDMYKNSLNEASIYLNTINTIKGLDYEITGKEYRFEEETLPFNGEECRVIRYKAYDGVAFDICELLGAHGIILDKLPDDYPVYITYYVNSNNEVVYMGCDASDAVSYLVMKRDGIDKVSYSDLIYEIYVRED